MTSPIETRTGLEAWQRIELPVPPTPKGFGWLSVVGPGVIVLGVSIGSGEFLLGPAVFVRYGFALLWVTLVAVFFQTIFNLEVMRYTMATGESVFTGFMRSRPSRAGWAWFYAVLSFLQIGWPAWAATSAGAIFFLFAGHLGGPQDGGALYALGVGTFLLCVGLLLLGGRIGRTLEILNWVLVSVIIGGFLLLALAFVPGSIWISGLLGFTGFDTRSQSFVFMPAGVDFFLIGALVAYSGSGGVGNLALSNWARDKGYGMGQHAGYIPSLIGGERAPLAHRGFMFTPDAAAMQRWRGWWRIVRVDQWAVFFVGALLGMLLPALLYVTFLPGGIDIRGLGISAALAEAIGREAGPLLAATVAILGAWLLFKTQLDLVEALTRIVTDLLWTTNPRVRRWRGGDVRTVYYSVLALVVIWGLAALAIAQPIVLLQLSANIAGFVLAFSSLHLLYVNMRLLPVELRPPLWRRLVLVAMSIFYSVFVVLAARTFF